MPEPTCLAAAVVASYVDGMLRTDERAVVEAHLAVCDDCLQLVLDVAREQEESGASRPSTKASQRSLWAHWSVSNLAIAASLLLAVGSAVFYFVTRTDSVDLPSLVGSRRPIEPRVTGGFQFGPLRTSFRGESTSADDRLVALAMELRQRAVEQGTPDARHQSAVAQLLVGDTAGAVAVLDQLTSTAPDVATYYADLGAARMALFIERGTEQDAVDALAALDRAIAISPNIPEAWFNKASVLEKLERRSDAIEAWTRYVAVERNAEWRAEGERHLNALRSITPP